MITVMGATGHTGTEIVRRLLVAGESVRALGRNTEKLRARADGGAQTRAGDVADSGFLAEAFRGADAVYTLVAPGFDSADYRAEQDRHGEAIARAVRASGVRQVVALSSLGAERDSGTGFLEGLHAQEGRLRALANEGVDIVVLRPGAFFENFEAAPALVERIGVYADSVDPGVELPMIAATDVAAEAASALLEGPVSGFTVRQLLGPRDLSFPEATRILGESLGRPDLAYVRLPDADMVAALVEAGFSASAASLYVAMTRSFNEGRVRALEEHGRVFRMPSRFEDFVRAA